MKKLGRLVVGLLTIGTVDMADGLYLKGGVALPGKATAKVNYSITGMYASVLSVKNIEMTADSQAGFFIQGEYTKNLSSEVEVGAGISIEPEVKVKYSGIEDKMGCSWIPVYGVLKYNVENLKGLYGTAKLGYGFANFTNDIKANGVKVERNGGVYYSLGIGGEFDYMVCEMNYSVNSGIQKVSVSDSYGSISEETIVVYPKIGVTVGYKL